jgi:hypothetical protein
MTLGDLLELACESSYSDGFCSYQRHPPWHADGALLIKNDAVIGVVGVSIEQEGCS